jgi:hypothetical protein
VFAILFAYSTDTKEVYQSLFYIHPLLDRRPRLRASPEESRWKTPKPEILSSLTAFEELQPGQEWLILHRL